MAGRAPFTAKLMIVQIYEIQTPHEAERCIVLGVDRLGSVLLSEEEWKNSDIREVIRLSEGTRTRNSLIPLFQTRDTLYRAMDYYRPYFLHLCESLTDDKGHVLDLSPFINLQKDFKNKFPEIHVVRSIPVPEQGKAADFPVLQIAEAFKAASDGFLIDTWLGREPVEGFIGITGKLADRDLSKKLVGWSSIPVILAGGLSPDNVHDAVIAIVPAGADSCSQTNLVNGGGQPFRFRKDFGKVDAFVREVRRADALLREEKTGLERKLHPLKARARKGKNVAGARLEEEIALIERELERYRWA